MLPSRLNSPGLPSRSGKGTGGVGPIHWSIFLARAVTLAGFVLTIFAGLFGSAVGSHNFAIIFVWIAWWTALKLVFIPLGGRSWCAVCPIPLPGEWLTRGGIFTTGRRLGLGLKWPAKIGPLSLRGSWMQAGGFLFVGLFSAVTLTTPRLTGWVLLGVLLAALVLSLVFEKRAFCTHACPIGGFTGLYAQAAPVEVRVRDRAVCAAHTEKTCYNNCPWGVYVTALDHNGPCGLCLECIRVCPHDNVSFNLREFGKDFITARKAPRPDEAYLALVMIACALAFSAVFLGPWGWLRSAAYAVGTLDWALYGVGFLLFAGVLVPGLWALAVRAGSPAAPSAAASARRSRLADAARDAARDAGRFSRPLLPLGLGAWIAFTIAFAFAKVSYVLPVLSDPFGLGWNLFGTAHTGFNPDVSWISPLLQAAVLVTGQLVSSCLIAREAGPPRRALHLFTLAVTVGMMWLLIG